MIINSILIAACSTIVIILYTERTIAKNKESKLRERVLKVSSLLQKSVMTTKDTRKWYLDKANISIEDLKHYFESNRRWFPKKKRVLCEDIIDKSVDISKYVRNGSSVDIIHVSAKLKLGKGTELEVLIGKLLK